MLIDLVLVLAVLEGIGRFKPDPRVHGFTVDHGDTEQTRLARYPSDLLFDPLAPPLKETSPDRWTFTQTFKFRPQEWTTPKPDATWRVIVIGDSTVYGTLPEVL
ncbi:MAG: hypothetical protein QGG40_19865, partial [Myxococcota bacterium]|nr:hypothetical protein [Myxococcota bacterium]